VGKSGAGLSAPGTGKGTIDVSGRAHLEPTNQKAAISEGAASKAGEARQCNPTFHRLQLVVMCSACSMPRLDASWASLDYLTAYNNTRPCHVGERRARRGFRILRVGHGYAACLHSWRTHSRVMASQR
jgi:hypothetical protein